MNLLIVDDEVFAIQGILEDIHPLKIYFQEIFTANSYAQAVNIFLGHKIDILLCDIEMPYGTGLDLVEWVKSQSPMTECIFLTCHDEFNFAKQAIQLQCLDYVLKPATAETVNGVLRKAIKAIGAKQKDQIYRDYGRIYFETIEEQEKEGGVDSRHAVEKVEEYIRLHIDEPLTVEELSQMVYLSPAHLSRLFKKKYNMTLIDYITNEKMKLAKELLERDELSITVISAKTGYNHYSYFTKMFKKVYGKTPREYRQSFHGKNS
ncbi:MAG TPA: response regulator transcription factor [Clostridiales bacterium]|nr:response regulator transcription factor [Clostridiales bacterium]